MDTTTGQWRLSDLFYLTVKKRAWRHLSKKVDPGRDILVFLRGQGADQSEEGWMVSVTSRTDLPEEAELHGYVGALGHYPLLVVQREHLDKLDGRTLSAKGGRLAVL